MFRLNGSSFSARLDFSQRFQLFLAPKVAPVITIYVDADLFWKVSNTCWELLYLLRTCPLFHNRIRERQLPVHTHTNALTQPSELIHRTLKCSEQYTNTQTHTHTRVYTHAHPCTFTQSCSRAHTHICRTILLSFYSVLHSACFFPVLLVCVLSVCVLYLSFQPRETFIL